MYSSLTGMQTIQSIWASKWLTSILLKRKPSTVVIHYCTEIILFLKLSLGNLINLLCLLNSYNILSYIFMNHMCFIATKANNFFSCLWRHCSNEKRPVKSGVAIGPHILTVIEVKHSSFNSLDFQLATNAKICRLPSSTYMIFTHHLKKILKKLRNTGNGRIKKLRFLHSNCTDPNICKHIIYPRDCCFLLHNSTAASTCWKHWLLKFCNQNRIFQGIRKKSCNISSCCNHNITAANVITTSLCLCGLLCGEMIFDVAWLFLYSAYYAPVDKIFRFCTTSCTSLSLPNSLIHKFTGSWIFRNRTRRCQRQ